MLLKADVGKSIEVDTSLDSVASTVPDARLVSKAYRRIATIQQL